LSEQTDPNQTEPLSSSVKNRRRRWAIRSGIGVGVAAILFVLVVFVLPTPLARYVIDAQLEDLGIQHDGIETVDVDLWNSHVRAGPVTFRAGDAQDGQIGETGFDYSFGQLFKGHAFVQTFYLRGVDLHIARLEDGSIEINGINLQEIAAPQDEATAVEQPPGEEKGASRFGFGVERFEFSDSKLVFEDIGGGALTIELQRLTLDRLRSWTPDSPTIFTLEGRLNDMQLALDGTIVPLGDPLIATLNTHVEGITLDRIARFIGPTGLARQAGTVKSQVHYDYAIYRDGRIEGKIDGDYSLAGFDVATDAGETLTLGEALLKVNLQQKLSADGNASATGQLQLDASSLAFANAAGDAAELGALDLSFDDLAFTKGAEKRRSLFELGSSAENADAASQKPLTLVQLMIGWAAELGRDALEHQLSIGGRPALTLRDGLLRTAARGSVPGQELRFEEMTVDMGDVTSEGFDAGASAEGTLATVIKGLRLAMQDGSAQAQLSQVSVTSNAISLRATTEETSLAFDLSLSLQDLAASDDQGASLDLNALSLTSDRFDLKETAESGTGTGPVALKLSGLTASLPGPGGTLALRGEVMNLALTPLSLTGKQGESASFAGSISMSGLSLERAGDSPLTGSLTSARTDLRDFHVAPLTARAEVAGTLVTSLSQIALGTGQGATALSLSLDTLDNEVEGLQASGFDSGEPNLSAAMRTRLSGLSAGLPLGAGDAARATVASLELPLSELAVSGGTVSAKGGLEVSGFSAVTTGEKPQSLELASLTLSGLAGDSETGAEIGSITLGEMIAKIVLAPPASPQAQGAAVGGTTPETAQAKVDAGESAAPLDKRLKVGELSLAPGSRIDITDSSVEPPMQTTVVLDELRLGPVDTGAPETRTDLTLALTANEVSKVKLQGWAAPFKPKPDFVLTSQVEALSLPPLSPYAASLVGVNIESGALSAGIDAEASEATLLGKIDLRVDDLFVTPLSEEEAEKLQAHIGLPIGFAVSILKDRDGVIAFGLPLSGTLDAPQVDYSEAINKAISGAMASVFPTNWFGPDGNTFEMQPAPFVPGTAELTEEGMAVADQMGGLFVDKPEISIRACGRAGRADLVALRGGPDGAPADTVAPAGALTPGAPSTSDAKGDVISGDGAMAAAEPGPDKQITAPEAEDIADPSDAEVEALLALATERGAAVRKYLEAKYGIAPDKVPECRTSYSIKDGKPPRAEFQF